MINGAHWQSVTKPAYAYARKPNSISFFLVPCVLNGGKAQTLWSRGVGTFRKVGRLPSITPFRPFSFSMPSFSKLPSYFPSLPFPFPPLLRGPPVEPVGGSGERCRLPRLDMGRSLRRQTICCAFESERAALVATLFVRFLRIKVVKLHTLHNSHWYYSITTEIWAS